MGYLLFIIKDASVFERFAYIQASKNGYVGNSRTLTPTPGTNEVTITLFGKYPTATLTSGNPASVSLPDGTLIELDGNYKDGDGNDYSGSIEVVMHHIDPTDETMPNQLPGMLYAANAENEERTLQSFGMVLVELIAENGEQLNLAEGSAATLHLPLPENFMANAPSTIPLWYFNEDKGYWIEEGEAELQGNEYVGKVSHFSFWGAATMANPVNLCLNIYDENNNPINASVFITKDQGTNNPTYYSKTYEDGEVCGMVPAGEILNLEVTFGRGACSSSMTTSIGPYATDGSETININLSQMGITPETVTGQLLNCNGNPVSNGYVRFFSPDNVHHLAVTENNGFFEINFLRCGQGSNFTIKGVDYDNLKITGVNSYTLTSPNTNVGTITTCGDSFSYIDLKYTMQIGGYIINEKEYHETNLILGTFGPLDSFNNYPVINVIRPINPTGVDFLMLGILDTVPYTYTGQNANNYLGQYSYNNTLISNSYNNNTGFQIFNHTVFDNDIIPTNIKEILINSTTFNVTNIGNVGGFIDVEIYGYYQSNSGIEYILTGEVHVQREK